MHMIHITQPRNQNDLNFDHLRMQQQYDYVNNETIPKTGLHIISTTALEYKLVLSNISKLKATQFHNNTSDTLWLYATAQTPN